MKHNLNKNTFHNPSMDFLYRPIKNNCQNFNINKVNDRDGIGNIADT